MTDVGDGTYTYSFTLLTDGAITMIIKLMDAGGVYAIWYPNESYSEPNQKTNITSNLYFSDSGINWVTLPSGDDYFTAEFTFTLKIPTTDTYTLSLYHDNGWGAWIDGVQWFDYHTIGNNYGTETKTISVTAGQALTFKVMFYETYGLAQIFFQWSTPTMSITPIPSTAFIYTKKVASSPYQITVNWPTGYTGSNPASLAKWIENWGDGLRVGSETCDDGNTSSGDGCSSTWTIESNSAWAGGSSTSKDVCTICSAGYSPNTDKTICQTVCGDGLRAGAEKCDDNNLTGGDGWSATWTIETNYICTGGSTTGKDTCSTCTAGLYPNTGQSAWETHCGDGLRAGTEGCDDQNTNNGDGCSSLWVIESNYVCSGGTTTSKDTCSACSAGLYQNTGKSAWEAHWGDGKRAGTEVWDDSNTSNADGCSSTCTIESNYIWTGGTTSSQDTWTACSAGYTPNVSKSACITVCGDGLRAGLEECDDQNTNNGDGWSSSWAIESNYVCSGGTTSAKDIWTAWAAGFYQNTGKSAWETHCGDGKRAGSEACDDQNTANSDGCSSTCAIEDNYVWSGGTTSVKDTCTAWAAGFYQNTGKSAWETHCGDGKRAGSETCDDQNSSNSDGCSSTCAIEDSYVWSGGTTSSKDTCSFCTSGFYQNDPKTICVTKWGDGKRAGSEQWDDQNILNSDGWNSVWSIESNYIWSGGTVSSKDTCSAWPDGLLPNASKDKWSEVWGDGLLAGSEICDDGNTINGDGCSSTCTVETSNKWVWNRVHTTTADKCTVWGSGFYINDQNNPRYWKTTCGDGKRVGSEVWDTGGLSNSPWENGCTTILAGFVWTGGDSTGADSCSKWPNSFQANSDQSSWDVKTVTYSMEIFGYLYVSIMLVGMISNGMSSYLFGYSFSTIYSIITHAQILLLTPLIEVSVDENVISFYRILKDVLLGLWFATTKVVFVGFDSIFGYDSYPQTSWYLKVIGFSDGS